MLQAERRNILSNSKRWHYDQKLLNTKHSLIMMGNFPIPPELMGHINTDWYEGVSENRLGYVEVPESVRVQFELGSYTPKSDQKISQMSTLDFVASRQNTKWAVLPIRTVQERKLVKRLILETKTDKSALDYTRVALAFNRSGLVDGTQICFKIPENISSFYSKIWANARNRDEAIVAAGNRRNDLSQNLVRQILPPPGVVNDPIIIGSVSLDCPRVAALQLPLLMNSESPRIHQMGDHVHPSTSSNPPLPEFSEMSSTVSMLLSPIEVNFRPEQDPTSLINPRQYANSNGNSQSNDLMESLGMNRLNAILPRKRDLKFVEGVSVKKKRVCGNCKVDGCPGRGRREFCNLK
jgi:hypothetical protein